MVKHLTAQDRATYFWIISHRDLVFFLFEIVSIQTSEFTIAKDFQNMLLNKFVIDFTILFEYFGLRNT